MNDKANDRPSGYDADKLRSRVGRRVRVTWDHTYNNGRTERRVNTGKLLAVTDTGALEVSGKPMSLPGFGACPVSHLIGRDNIVKVVLL